MTNKKLTDKEIKKALECCANGKCGECPLFKEDCGDDIICKIALDFITRQQAKIDEFMKETAVTTLLDDAVVYTPTLEDYNKFKKKFKSEAYKELAERVKEKSGKMEMVCSGALVQRDYTISEKTLDNLVKDMMVVSKNDR